VEPGVCTVPGVRHDEAAVVLVGDTDSIFDVAAVDAREGIDDARERLGRRERVDLLGHRPRAIKREDHVDALAADLVARAAARGPGGHGVEAAAAAGARAARARAAGARAALVGLDAEVTQANEPVVARAAFGAGARFRAHVARRGHRVVAGRA